MTFICSCHRAVCLFTKSNLKVVVENYFDILVPSTGTLSSVKLHVTSPALI